MTSLIMRNKIARWKHTFMREPIRMWRIFVVGSQYVLLVIPALWMTIAALVYFAIMQEPIPDCPPRWMQPVFNTMENRRWKLTTLLAK